MFDPPELVDFPSLQHPCSIPWRRVTEDHNFLLAFHGFLQINGARIHIAIRDQDQDSSSLASSTYCTSPKWNTTSVSMPFYFNPLQPICHQCYYIYMYIYITIYRYGIVAEGSETHHFRGRQNSPKEVPTCLIQKCASLAFLPQCDKKVFRQLAAASHSTSGLSLMLLKEAPHLFQACLEHWRRTWMPGLPGLSTTEAFFWACRRDVPGLVN